MSKRDEYAEKLKQTIDELNSKIDELEAKAEHAQNEAKGEINKQIEAVKLQMKPLTDKLDKWKEEGEDKLEGYVKEAKKIRDAFIHSYNYFKSQIK
ncbi:hypothetical protein [Aestuariibacter salexigens]|uniref:hypothetical protein n=1 Tax=Aestuariibacter salexigens TaxID=226010 RepID=UPI0003F9615F|nr:hypothetical protein [Aestuariibacter salexigens]